MTVEGYKSIAREQSIEIRPLTILAGANSSGKSSMIQPLLLLKQTLELGYDPGAVLINGENVKFTSTSQFLSRISDDDNSDKLKIGIEIGQRISLTNHYELDEDRGLLVQRAKYTGDRSFTLRYGMSNKQIRRAVFKGGQDEVFPRESILGILRVRSFLHIELRYADGERFIDIQPTFLLTIMDELSERLDFEHHIQDIIHLPGLRGNPERAYPRSAAGPSFPGTFENYTASVLAQWEIDGRKDKIKALIDDLVLLGLTSTVSAKRIDETQISLQVGRLCHEKPNGEMDLVDISDVGFGTSQTLPILVALHTARRGQIVFIEQPETHLHPRAQYAMARTLANAANRGVRVVVETHSALLLLGIQALVASNELDKSLVILHWFERATDGCTEITAGELDESGAFGSWPEDFGKVQLDAQDSYLDARELRMDGSHRE